MDNEKQKNVKLIHLLLGLFFTISGISTLVNERYLFSTWIISLGLFFLFDSFKITLGSKISPKTIIAFHYILASIVFITGVIAMLMEFEILGEI